MPDGLIDASETVKVNCTGAVQFLNQHLVAVQAVPMLYCDVQQPLID